MSDFGKLREVLVSYNKDVCPLAEGKRKKTEEAKAEYNSGVLPEKLKKIESIYSKALQQSRETHLRMLDDAVQELKRSNSGKYIPFRIDYDLLQKMNLISQSGVKLTAEEIKNLCEISLVSRSEFCVRKCQMMAKDSGYILRVPDEKKANQIVSDAAEKIKDVIEKFSGDSSINHTTGGYMIQIKLNASGDFLNRVEKEYDSCSLSGIEITEAVPEENQKEDVALPGNLGVIVEGNGEKESDAAKYAREYSERMTASSIEAGGI